MIERNITAIGRLTADAEFKKIGENNTPTVALRIAVNHQDGDKEFTEFVNANLWGEKRVDKWREKAQLKKGAQVFITGQENSREGETKAGDKEIFRSVEIRAIRVLETVEAMAQRRAEREEQPA